MGVLLSVDAQVRNHLQENVRHSPEGCCSLLRIYEQESPARAHRGDALRGNGSGKVILLLDRLICRIEHKK